MTQTESVLAALAEPNRLKILGLLAQRPHAVGELVDRVGLSQPGTSKHLKVLRDTGLVRSRVNGKQRVYELRAEPLRKVDEWLEPYRRLWATSLDRLEHALDEEKP